MQEPPPNSVDTHVAGFRETLCFERESRIQWQETNYFKADVSSHSSGTATLGDAIL